MKKTDNISLNEEVKTAFKPAVIYGVGYIIQNFVFLLCTILIAKIMGASDFGLYSLALSVVGLGAILSTLGLNVIPSRFIPRYLHKKEIPQLKDFLRFILRMQTLLSIIIAIVLVCSAGLISVKVYNKPELLLPLILLSLIMPVQKLTDLLGTIFAGFKEIKYSVYVQSFFGPLLRLAILLPVFFFWQSTLSVYLVLYIQLTGTLSVFLFVFRKKIWKEVFPETLPEVFCNRKEALLYGLPLFIPYIIDYLMGRIDILVIGYFLSSDQIGIYNIAFKLSLIVTLSLLSLDVIFSPIISELYSKGEYKKLELSYKAFTRIILYISIFTLGAIFILGKSTLSVVGRNYAAGSGALFILSVGHLFNVAAGSANKLFSMTRYPKISLYNSITQLTLNLGLNILWVPRYGITGAAYATAISITFISLVRLFELRLLFGMHPFSLSYLKPFVSGVISLFIPWLAYHLFQITSPAALFSLFLLSYLAAIFALGIEKEERFMLSLLKKYNWTGKDFIKDTG